MIQDIESNEVEGLIQKKSDYKHSIWLQHNYVKFIELGVVGVSCTISNYLMHNPLCNAMFRCGCSLSEGILRHT
jgi:hypothetical protein